MLQKEHRLTVSYATKRTQANSLCYKKIVEHGVKECQCEPVSEILNRDCQDAVAALERLTIQYNRSCREVTVKHQNQACNNREIEIRFRSSEQVCS